MTRTLPVLVLALALPLASAQDPKPKAALPKVTAVGLSVTKPGPVEDASTVGVTGTHVTVLVEIPDRFIIGLDTRDSKLESLTDDRGTDLRTGAGGGRGRLAVSPDGLGTTGGGKHVKAIFRGPGLPAAGATRVHVKGTVAVAVGKTEKTVEKKDVSLKAGADVGFGTFTIGENAGFGKARQSSSVVYRGSKVIRQVTFTDPTGAEVPLRQTVFGATATLTLRRGEMTTATFRPERGGAVPDKGTLKVTYFEDVENFEVPVDLEVGPGL